MTIFEIPTLTTDRLRLRAFRAADLDAYAAMQANPDVMRHIVMAHLHAGRGLANDADVARLMGFARLRHVGLREDRGRGVRRQRRHLPSPRLAGTRDRLLARPAVLRP